MALELDFYKTKSLMDLNQEEWEALCDGCGQCCFRKYIDGHGRNTKLIYTCIACDLLDLKTGLCSDYQNRFKKNKECTHLTKKNVDEFTWLPETCAYRCLYENRPLPEWHPLVCGKPVDKNPDAQKFFIKNGILEKDVDDWENYILSEKYINDEEK